jgi:hypothetical protein
MPRKSRQVETRLISEYLKDRYSHFTFITKQAVGKVPEDLMASEGYKRAVGLSRPFRPEVDAVVILPRHLIVVEAKVWNIINGLAKLPLYKSLVPVTPELQKYMPREVLMQLVVGWTNDNLEIMAREIGVTVKVYCPDWLKPIVDGMQKYWTSDAVRDREYKKKMREMYGLD